MDDREALIALDAVDFAYPQRPALFRQLDFAVYPGEPVGLVGASGSGKTSLFRILVGLLGPQSGRVRAFGLEMRREADFHTVRQRVGFLFQDARDQLVCPTVLDEVAFGPLNHGDTPENAANRAHDALTRLGLQDYAQRNPHELSGGEQRLVALATAIVHEPDLLILDEPTSGLDPRARRQLIEHLGQLDGTQLIASHDMEFIRAACQRVAVLDAGAIVADGPTDDILGDEERMFQSGLEVPYSLAARADEPPDHHHGAGPSHGHGHRPDRRHREHGT